MRSIIIIFGVCVCLIPPGEDETFCARECGRLEAVPLSPQQAAG